jgi:hypothetical protein
MAIRSLRYEEIPYRVFDRVVRRARPVARFLESQQANMDDLPRVFGGLFDDRNEFCHHIRTRRSPRFFFCQDDFGRYGEVLRTLFAEEARLTAEDADRALAHVFRVFDQELTFDGPVNWHFSADTHKEWPMRPWYEIQTTGSECPGDVKYVWELNRHGHLVTLGRAYWQSGDEKYASEFCEQIRNWLRANPLGQGVNWCSGLEIAIRATAWIWCISFFLRSPHLGDDLLWGMVRALLYSGRRLASGLGFTRHCVRNNHFIGELTGLLSISLFLPESVESGNWLERARSALVGELEAQSYADGVSMEQSFGYQVFVVELYFLALRYLRIAEASVPDSTCRRLEAMVEFLQAVRKPDRKTPIAGDWDEGRVLPLGSEATRSLESVFSTAACWFERADFKFTAGRLSEQTLWLLGLDGVRRYGQLDARPPFATGLSFPNGGYHVVRSGWGEKDDFLMFRCGPHGVHGHADQLSIEVSARGVDLVLDPGNVTYNGDPALRAYFRGTSAHSTVVVDDLPQSVPFGTFRWLKVAKPTAATCHFGTVATWMRGGHLGYQRLKRPTTHFREILFVHGNYLLVFDRFATAGLHTYDISFQLPPGGIQIDGESQACRLTVGEQAFTIAPLDPCPTRAIVTQGQMTPRPSGWMSEGYGRMRPSPRLVLKKTANGPAVFATLIDMGRRVDVGRLGSIPGDPARLGDGYLVWEIRDHSGESHTVAVRSSAGTGRLKIGLGKSALLETDAEALLVEGSGDEIRAIFAVNVAELCSEPIRFISPRRMPFAEVMFQGREDPVQAYLDGDLGDQLEVDTSLPFSLHVPEQFRCERRGGESYHIERVRLASGRHGSSPGGR